jgi:RimJ/RimL family protein N-acetyltransferase
MNPILREFPDSFESKRLLIRSPRPGDGEAFNTAVLESWSELQPWMPWATQKPTVAEHEARLRESHAKFMTREDLWLLLFLKDSHTIVGSSGLHVKDWDVPRFEIGYWARTSFAGQGYITEAVLAITDFAFNQIGAQRLEIQCDSLNERSAAVAQRAGYTLECIQRHHHRHHLTGDLRDQMFFARLPTAVTG